jgi:hypothetical protein
MQEFLDICFKVSVILFVILGYGVVFYLKKCVFRKLSECYSFPKPILNAIPSLNSQDEDNKKLDMDRIVQALKDESDKNFECKNRKIKKFKHKDSLDQVNSAISEASKLCDKLQRL